MGMFVRALSYMMSHGSDGLRRVAEDAVLNANYLRARLEKALSAAYPGPCMHEVLFDDGFLKDTGITTLDFAKALIDEGFHPMTMYFPLVVHGALLIEPTETESKASLDQFADAVLALAAARPAPKARLLTLPSRAAPRLTPRRRLDETGAARKPILRWLPELGPPRSRRLMEGPIECRRSCAEQDFRFYFYSHEANEPPHVHVDKTGASAKLWLAPVRVARNIGLAPRTLAEAVLLVRQSRAAYWRPGMHSIAETVPDTRVRKVRVGKVRLSVDLMDGRSVIVPIAWYPRLLAATPAQRRRWEMAGGGYGIHWPEIDEDLSTEGLLRGEPAP